MVLLQEILSRGFLPNQSFHGIVMIKLAKWPNQVEVIKLSVLGILKLAAAVVTMGTGFVGAIAPNSVTGFTGLSPVGSRGISEIRAVIGGLFIGLALAVIIFRSPAAYRTLGIGYLTIACVRAISMGLDNAWQGSNWISLGFEVVFGVLLML